jgi:hypothetical protein
MRKKAVEFAETVSGCPETDDSYARILTGLR